MWNTSRKWKQFNTKYNTKPLFHSVHVNVTWNHEVSNSHIIKMFGSIIKCWLKLIIVVNIHKGKVTIDFYQNKVSGSNVVCFI